MAKETDRNNRSIHAGSPAGDPTRTAEGAIVYDTITAPAGLLGQPTMGKSRDQPPTGNMPNDMGPSGEGAFTFQSGGEKELLGQGTGDEGLKDDELPHPPDPSLSGESGTTNMGQQGAEVNWKSVGEYRYPEFPADTLPQKIADGIQNVTPLT